MTTTNSQLINTIQGLRDLPVLSLVREQGLNLLQVKTSTRRDLAQALRYDQVLSAKILRLVNSASFGLLNPVSDIEKALSFVGEQSLQVLFLGSNVFSPADLAPPFCLGSYWRHNYMVAYAASLIAEASGKARASDVFSCGLLHDLGKLAFWKSNPALFCRVLDTRALENISFFEAEQILQLPGHHVLGETLARSWKLPYAIRMTMRFHHRDVLNMSTLEESTRLQISCVMLANHIVKVLELGCAWGQSEGERAQKIMVALGISESQCKNFESALDHENLRISNFWHSAFSSKVA